MVLPKSEVIQIKELFFLQSNFIFIYDFFLLENDCSY